MSEDKTMLVTHASQRYEAVRAQGNFETEVLQFTVDYEKYCSLSLQGPCLKWGLCNEELLVLKSLKMETNTHKARSIV
jgi:hypothetical protein